MLLTSAIKKILFLSGMRIAAMTGHAGNSRDLPLLIFIEMKVFFIDLGCHLKHLTGDVLFGFGVAGKIQVMRSAVGGGSMTEITFYTQGGLPAVHDLVQVLVADVLGQDFQVFEFSLSQRLVSSNIRGTGGRHAEDRKSGQRQGNSQFFTMHDHNGRFRRPI